MPKQTRLSENASIYQQRQELSEKEKLKDMSLRGRLVYLWEYYRIHALAILLVIGFAVYIIYSIVTPKVETELYAAIINNTISDEIWEQYQTDVSDYLKLDPKRQDVILNRGFYLNGETEYAMNMQTALMAYVSAGDVDLLIAPESQFQQYTNNGFNDKLYDDLPTDLYSELTDCLYVTSTEDDPEESAYGIYLTDTKLFSEYADNTEPYILGIIVNSDQKENAIEFIRMLFHQ
jgi:ABC-type molybdate transport system substrate-binding protein